MKEMTLREIQLVSLDILKDIHQFCINNNIRYYMAYGTLLGAVRHKGFIPWDDDIDIVMPRPDYDLFVKKYTSDKGIHLYTHKNSKCMISYARACDIQRTTIEFQEKPWSKNKTGIYIDIFPLDAIKEDSFEQQKEQAMKLWKRSWSMRYAMIPFKKAKGWSKKSKWMTRKLILMTLGSRRINKHISLCKHINWNASDFICQFACPDLNEGIIRKEWYDETVMLPFEDSVFAAPKDWDAVLRNTFGDYMQLPPEEQRIPKLFYAKFYFK